MADANTIKASEIASYDFGDVAPPEGYNPDVKGFERPPAGWHRFKVIKDAPEKKQHAYEIEQNKSFGGKNPWVGNELRVRLEIPPGQPFAGASIMDFIPVPTPGRPMPAFHANRWANFLKGLNFKVPSDKVVPPGFKLSDLDDRQGGWMEVIDDKYTDAQGVDKEKIKVALFGYRATDDPPPNTAASKTRNGGVQTKANSGTSAPAPAPQAQRPDPAALDLSDL